MRRVVLAVTLACAALVGLARDAAAQEGASIIGLVQDTSGAVMPGVTVEASSDALIERVRSAVTDGAGRFAIISLRPGTYTVTFTLPGFRTMRREGIVLQGNFAATVNADLDVGALEETVTVSGASPVVDLQSTQNQFAINKEILDVLPATRSMQGGASLVPGVNFYSQGFVSTMSVHGSASADQRIYFDGMRIGQNLTGTGSQANGTGVNDLGQEELVFDAGSQSAETALGGVRMDSIPKEGGNRFSGAYRWFFSNGSLQNDNVPEELNQFIQAGDELRTSWQSNFTLGGPIMQNRLWFFTAVRFSQTDSYVADMVLPDGSLLRLPNGERVNRDSRVAPNGQLRLTAQLSSRDKLRGAYYNSNGRTQRYDVGCTATSGNRVSCVSPEAAYALPTPVQQSGDMKWTSTVTNRLLVEVGASFGVASYRFEYQPENGPHDILNNDTATGWRTVASGTPYQDYLSTVWNVIPKVSYVTGSHNFKAGMNLEWGDDRNYIDNHHSISTLTLNASRPLATRATSVTVRNTPVRRLNELNADSGFFVQDRWTMSRLSMFGGFRYDWFNAGWRDQYAPANPFVPERTIPAADCQPCWSDWSIRAGASYDLFGTGRTALKFSLGKFLAANALGTTTSLNPLGAQSDTRTWTDRDLNGSVIDAAGNIQMTEIGPPRSNTFGTPAGTLRLEDGFERGNNWEEAISVQHELVRNMSVTVGYYRRQFYNLVADMNLAVDPNADYTEFTVRGPTHPNLPNGGGELITLYNLNPNKQGASDPLRINSDGRSRVYNGFEVSVNARFPRGFAFGGITTEREAVDSCADLSNPNSLRFCSRTPPFRTLYKASAGYMLPYDVQLAGSFQARPGIPLGAEWTVDSATSVASGGVPLTGGVSSITVDLIEPTTTFYDYVYTNDMTVSRVFRINRTRIRGFVEMFNVLNLSTIYTRNETFGPQWYNPIDLVGSRRFQFGAQIDW
jgi:Carboxypeptidase regulatory-like domain